MALPGIDISSVIPIYQHYISEMIEKLGKPVRLYMGEIDPTPEDEDSNLPDWKDQTDNDTIPVYEELKALIEYSPSEFRKFGVKVEKPESVIQLKTYLTDVNRLMACKWIEPSLGAQPIIISRYRLIRKPIPQGLGEDKFAVSFWEQLP